MAIQLQCPSCEKVLQVADSAAGKKVRCPGCQSLVDIPATGSLSESDTPVAKPKQAAESVKTTTTTSSVKVTCQSCGKVLKAPHTAVGKAVRCPGCQSVVRISEASANTSSSPTSLPAARPPTSPVTRSSAPKASSANPVTTDASASTGNALWDALGDIPNSTPTSSGWETPTTNPYASTSSYGYSGSGRSSGAGSNRNPLYIINGIIIALWGLLLGIGSIIRIVNTIYLLSNLPPNVPINYPFLIGGIIGVIIGMIVAAIQVIGGIQMATRSSLSNARNAAILAAVPCFGGCVFPFGIWAAILLYSKKAKRDFGEE